MSDEEHTIIDRETARKYAEAILEYADQNLVFMGACDMRTDKAETLFYTAKSLWDLLIKE